MSQCYNILLLQVKEVLAAVVEVVVQAEVEEGMLVEILELKKRMEKEDRHTSI